MLSKHNSIQRDQLVPENHLVRKIEAAIDFSFIYDLVKDMYSEVGRPSIDPVILIKLAFVQYTFGIRCHECKENGQLDLARFRNGLNDDLEEVYYSL